MGHRFGRTKYGVIWDTFQVMTGDHRAYMFIHLPSVDVDHTIPNCFVPLTFIIMLQFANHLQHRNTSMGSGTHFRSSGHHISLLHQAPTLFLDTLHAKHDLCPNFDVRETAAAYFLEGEFPGISGPHAIKVEWLDGNTLRVTGHIYKTDLEADWATDNLGRICPQATVKNELAAQSASEDVFLPLHRFDDEDNEHSVAKGITPKEWLSERGIGAFVRTFDLPSAVNTDGTRVKLHQGLLVMMVPKVKENSDASKIKEIAVES
jgi:HSP20 family protein